MQEAILPPGRGKKSGEDFPVKSSPHGAGARYAAGSGSLTVSHSPFHRARAKKRELMDQVTG